jgi:hypothetical protein
MTPQTVATSRNGTARAVKAKYNVNLVQRTMRRRPILAQRSNRRAVFSAV